MGKQPSEVGNQKIYLMDLQQELILLNFHPHLRACLGACFFAHGLEILYTSHVNIYLGICFEIISQSPIYSKLELGAKGPLVVMSCLDTRS